MTTVTEPITEVYTTVATPNPFITVRTDSPPAWKYASVNDWEVVDGWFAEYPLSIGMNRSVTFLQCLLWREISIFRFATKHQAFDVCVKAEDCGGISKNNDGTWECRAWEFVQEYGAISYAKPENFHDQS